LHSSAVSVLLASNLEFFSAWSMPCLYVACDHAAKASQPVREEVCKIFAWSLDYFLRDFLSVHCWRLYFVGALLVDVIPNLMSGGESLPLSGPPSFEDSSPRRAFEGGLRCPDVLLLVLPSARRGIVISDNTLFKLFSTTLSPHPVSELSQVVRG
jgi:hypothetical protein